RCVIFEPARLDSARRCSNFEPARLDSARRCEIFEPARLGSARTPFGSMPITSPGWARLGLVWARLLQNLGPGPLVRARCIPGTSFSVYYVLRAGERVSCTLFKKKKRASRS